MSKFSKVYKAETMHKALISYPKADSLVLASLNADIKYKYLGHYVTCKILKIFREVQHEHVGDFVGKRGEFRSRINLRNVKLY